MIKRINKAKLIKQYIGSVIKEYGFEYVGSQAGIVWLFERQKNGVKQEVYLQEIRFVHMVTMRFHSYTHGWSRPIQPGDYMEKYKDREFWEYQTEEEYVKILEEFADILKSHGLEMLERMLLPADPVYPTEEMERKLSETYPALIEEARSRYPFERTGEEAVRKVSELIYRNKDKDYEEVKDFLVEMAAVYMEIFMNAAGGETKKKEFSSRDALRPIVARWKANHDNIPTEENLLLLIYCDLNWVKHTKTPQMQKALYETYPNLLEDIRQRYALEMTGEEAIKEISALIYQKKDEKYEDVQDFLVEMAAVYLKILIDDNIGDELILTPNQCEIVKYESWGAKGFYSPLGIVVSGWEQCHYREISLLLSEYNGLKENGGGGKIN